MEWADACVFGTPTRFGNVSSQLKQFMDTLGGLWFEGKLAVKVVGVFTSASTPHGGQDTTIASLFNVFAHWGANKGLDAGVVVRRLLSTADGLAARVLIGQLDVPEAVGALEKDLRSLLERPPPSCGGGDPSDTS